MKNHLLKTLCIVISGSKINISFPTNLTSKIDIKIDDTIKLRNI